MEPQAAEWSQTLRPSDDVLQALSSLDDRLVQALERGDIRFLRSAWVNQQPDTYRLQWRQELEKLDHQGAKSALMSPKEAVTLVRKRNRGAGALTYGASQEPGFNLCACAPGEDPPRIQCGAFQQPLHVDRARWQSQCAAADKETEAHVDS